MSTRQEVVLICDLCDQDEHKATGIGTHRVEIDGVGVEAEVCEKDWEGVVGCLALFASHGRPVPARTKVRNLKSVPGTAWRFTAHALIRCGERNLDPVDVVAVIEDPKVTRPGKASDQEIRERNGIKAVVVPDRGVIVTVARKGEEAVDAYVADKVG